MTVEEFLQYVRYQINDTDKVEYTDAELINYLNQAIRFVSNELIKLSSPLLLKQVPLSLTDGAVDLPSDFIREEAVLNDNGEYLVSVPPTNLVDETSYKILGNKLYSGSSNITLFYYAPYSQVTALTDSVPVPDWMVHLLQEMVVYLALNRNEYSLSVEEALFKSFASQVYELTKNIGQGGNFERPVPFKV